MSKIASTDDQIETIAAALPKTYATRWSPARKAAVVRAVQVGILAPAKALALYRLSRSEFKSWQKSFADEGLRGLTAKQLAHHR